MPSVDHAPEHDRERDQERDEDRDFDLSGHVIGQLGLHVAERDGERHLDLDLVPLHLDDDGQVGFGVLGVFLDLASSQPPEMHRVGPWVHADITIHRLRAPRGTTLRTAPRMARMGRRSGIVEIEVHDDLGVHVARSVQEVVFPQGAPRAEVHDDADADDEGRERFLQWFQGTCRLAGPLPEVLGVRRGGDDGGRAGWTMPLSELGRNGFGALHGGSALSLVDAAAAGVVAEQIGAPARTLNAAVRYLAPGMQGPFRAVPRLVGHVGSAATVVVEVRDTGAEDRLIILADAVVATEGAA